MRCPICRKRVQPGTPEAPFCSERCRLIDLANWADEKYRIPAWPEEPELEEQPEGKHDGDGE
ncbi:MAG: DNA gyrase inhibitor YacG [bacterium]